MTRQVTHRPIKCQSRLLSQRGTKVNGSHHGDNPLLRPTWIQIATKSYAALQAMAPTNVKTVHETSLLHISRATSIDSECTTRRTSLYTSRGTSTTMSNAWCTLRKYTLKLYDRPSAPLELKIRMLRAEVLETMLYGCVTWSPRACHYDTLRRAHHRFLTRCIGWRKHNRADHPISYLDTLIKTGSESIEATLRRRRILFAGFVARMEDTRLPKCVMFGELVEGAGCVGGHEKECMGCSWTTSELSASTPTSG